MQTTYDAIKSLKKDWFCSKYMDEGEQSDMSPDSLIKDILEQSFDDYGMDKMKK